MTGTVALSACLATFVSIEIADDSVAYAKDGTCTYCGDDDPDPPVPEPTGGAGGFYGQAAVFTKNGDVVDSGGGSSCADCEWKWERACAPGEIGCSDLIECRDENGELENELYDVFLRRGENPWQRQGNICVGDETDILTTEDVGAQLNQQWAAMVPEQDPSMQPPGGRTLVNLPTYFHSGQPEQMPPTDVQVFNFEVQVAAHGTWH